MKHVMNWTGMLLAGVVVSGCGGGGAGTTETPAATGSGTGIFGQDIYTFDNYPVFTGIKVEDQVVRSRYRKTGDVISIKEEAILGPSGLDPVKEYAATATQFVWKPPVAGADGVKSAFLNGTSPTSFSLALYNESGLKNVGLATLTFETRPLAGLPLSDSVQHSLGQGPAQLARLKHLKESGRTFPAGSELYAVTRLTYHEDTVEFTEDDLVDDEGLAAWRSAQGEAEFRNYSFHGVSASCVEEVGVPVPQQYCAAEWGGQVFEATVYPKGEYTPIMPIHYFNGTAASSLTAGIQADYR